MCAPAGPVLPGSCAFVARCAMDKRRCTFLQSFLATCSANECCSSCKNSRYRKTGGVYSFFISAPHEHCGRFPAVASLYAMKISLRQTAFMQCQHSPISSFMAGTPLQDLFPVR